MSLLPRQALYNGLMHLALPLIAGISWRKCSKAQQEVPELKGCFAQKFGKVNPQFQKNGIVIHAVSLGETLSILPLLKQLKTTYPNLPITLTNGSVRGAKQLAKQLPEGIQYTFLPLDFPFAVKRFLKQLQPQLMIVVETEIWPNLIQACHQQQVPLILANARLKQSSMQSYQKVGGDWLAKVLNHVDQIACQFPVDKQHFIEMGVDKRHLSVMGNLKFDIKLSESQRQNAQQWQALNLQTATGKKRFCWVAASTHDHADGAEESLMLQAHKQLLQSHPDALLILVPRQADRFSEVAELIQSQGFTLQKRSELGALNAQAKVILDSTQVLHADSVGEMMHWMGVCDSAFIGGSMVNFGGHNILEPAAWQKPVISGPHYQNLKALYDVFIDDDSIEICADVKALADHLQNLAEQPELKTSLGQKAFTTFTQQSGALPKLLELIETTRRK